MFAAHSKALSGRIPFQGQVDGAVYGAILSRRERPPKHPSASPTGFSYSFLWEAAERAWADEPRDRPSMTNLLPFLRSPSIDTVTTDSTAPYDLTFDETHGSSPEDRTLRFAPHLPTDTQTVTPRNSGDTRTIQPSPPRSSDSGAEEDPRPRLSRWKLRGLLDGLPFPRKSRSSSGQSSQKPQL